MKAFLVAGLGLLLLLGGCVAWNETGITRAERRVRRIARPGMEGDAAMAALRDAGIEVYESTRTAKGFCGMFPDVQNIYIGTATLHFTVWTDGDGRVLEVTTTVTTSCL